MSLPEERGSGANGGDAAPGRGPLATLIVLGVVLALAGTTLIGFSPKSLPGPSPTTSPIAGGTPSPTPEGGA